MNEQRDRAREAVGEGAGRAAQGAEELREKARTQAAGQVSERSTQAGQQAESVAQTMRQAGEQMRGQGNDLPAQLAEWTATQADRLGRYLRETDGESIIRDVEGFGRRQPWVIAGIGLAAGMAAARILKASGNRGGGDVQPEYGPPGTMTGAPREWRT